MVVMATGLSEEKEKKALIQKLHVPSIENVLCYAGQEKKLKQQISVFTCPHLHVNIITSLIYLQQSIQESSYYMTIRGERKQSTLGF